MKRVTLPLVIFGAWCLGMAFLFGDLEPYLVGAFCWGLAWLNERMNLRLGMTSIYDKKEIKETYDFTPLRTLFEEGERK